MILSADKFGYYTVGDLKTYSKLEAIEWQTRTGIWPEWNFNKHIFDSYNWHIEPTKSLWEMYKERAIQIRNEYDYIVLFYSGGSDSSNILSAWLEAGCKIDEIASMINLEGSSKRRDLYDNITDIADEPFRLVRPKIKQLQEQGYKFKFREIDICQHTLDFIDLVKDDYFYYMNHSPSPNNIIKAIFRQNIPDYKKLIAEGKRLCFVWGTEKPSISTDANGWYFTFNDILDNCVNPFVQQRYNDGWYDELFYWSPDYPEIVIKQAHTVKNYITAIDTSSQYQTEKTKYGQNPVTKKYLKESVLKRIIYPKWQETDAFNARAYAAQNTLLREGFPRLVYSPRDRWFFNNEGIELVEKYDKHFHWMVKDLKNNRHYDWIHDVNSLSRSFLKGHIQKHYFA